MRLRFLPLVLVALAALWSPARAQFADQATYAGAAGGSANAQTITVPNASTYTDLQGVLIKFLPVATNTGAVTLNVNGFGTSPSFRKLGGAGLTALTGGELVINQPAVAMFDGTFFDIMSPTSDTVGARMLGNSALGYNDPINLQIATSVGASALTITVETAAGGTPSGSTPVPFVFSTISGGAVTGAPAVVSLQAALSFTIASGSTMGCQSAVVCRLWIIALNNAGTIQLCAYNALSGATVVAWNEGIQQTSQSGTGGGNNAQEFYCNASAVSGAIRAIGYLEVTEATAGTWTTAPAKVQLFGPGISKPGGIVQTVTSSSTTQSTTTATVTPAALSPAVTQAIVTSSAANLVRVSIFGSMTAGVAVGHVQFARSTTLIGILLSAAPSVGQMPASLSWLDAPATAGSVTYNLYGASNSGATLTWATTGSGYYWQLDEIMGALPEPANDDGGPLRMVG